MAYAANITITKLSIRDYFVSISETDAQNTSETTIVDSTTSKTLPLQGRVLRQVCFFSSGTGSTVDPVLGTATGVAGINIIMENDVASALIDNQPVTGIPYYSETGTLYHKSKVDSGTNNSVVTHYYIREGWVE